MQFVYRANVQLATSPLALKNKDAGRPARMQRVQHDGKRLDASFPAVEYQFLDLEHARHVSRSDSPYTIQKGARLQRGQPAVMRLADDLFCPVHGFLCFPLLFVLRSEIPGHTYSLPSPCSDSSLRNAFFSRSKVDRCSCNHLSWYARWLRCLTLRASPFSTALLSAECSEENSCSRW